MANINLHFNAAVWVDFGRPPVLFKSIKKIFDYINRLRSFSVLGLPTLARYAIEEQMKCANYHG